MRRTLIVVAIALLIAGSLTAQVLETRLGNSISGSTQRAIPRHSCTPTLCTFIPAPRRLPGGWPDPFLPALLLFGSLATGVAAMRLRTPARSDAEEPKVGQ